MSSLTRREFLNTAAAGAMAASLGGSLNAAAPSRKPNVVFLLADQWRAQATAYAGDVNARTPHLDRLATQGPNLVNAVSGCPVCSPYRGSLMTGRYWLSHGVFLNDVCLNTEAVSLAQGFRQAGYETGYIGKWHLDGHGRSNFIPPQRRQGFQFWRTCECTHNYNRSLYYGDTDQKLYWQDYDAIAQTDEACQYIRARGQNPFLLVLSWGPPHNPYETAPQRFRNLYKPGDIVLRKNVPAEMQEAARRDLAGYYAHIAALDECVGRVVATLAECGVEEDTILVFTSDHGDMLGSQGQVRKQRPWDESIRVPLLVRWPRGLGRQSRPILSPINTPDLMPTLLGLAGAEIPKTVEGADRSGLLRGQEADGDRPVLITCASPFGEWTRARGGREYRGVRTQRYTYVRTLDGPWLLYDNQEDPLQEHNLVEDAGRAPIRAELERQLAQILVQTRDDFRPGEEYVRRWGYVTDERGTVPYKQ